MLKTKKSIFIIYFFVIFPIFMGFLLVFLFGVNLPMLDDWMTVRLLEKYHSGNLSFHDLFAQHNEHRIFFSRIIRLLLGIVTKYSNVAEMYFIQFLLLIALTIIFIKLKKEYGFYIKEIPIWFLPIPLLIFSWKQIGLMLWGITIGFIMPLVFALLTFYFIDLFYKKNVSENKKMKKYLYFIFAAICASIASFSFLNGLLVWIAGIFQIIILSNKISKRGRHIITWFVLGCVEWILYFLNYHKPKGHPSILSFLSDPLDFIHSFFAMLGNSLYWDKEMSFAAGILIVISLLISIFYVYKNKKIKENSFWLTILLYSILVITSILVSRIGFGTKSILASRYTSYSIPILWALYIIVLNLIHQLKKKYILFTILGVLLTLIATGNYVSYIKGYKSAERIKKSRVELAFALVTYENQPDEILKKFNPHLKLVKKWALFLKKYGYSVFNDYSRKYPQYTIFLEEKNILHKTSVDSWTIKGKWGINSIFKKTMPKDSMIDYVYGSWMGSDKNKGIIKSKSYRITDPVYLVIYVIYTPRRKNQILGLDFNNDGNIDISFKSKSRMPHTWEKWIVDLEDFIGKEISVIAYDKGSDHGQWMGISQPIFYKKIINAE